jgi:hypothetical protein
MKIHISESEKFVPYETRLLSTAAFVFLNNCLVCPLRILLVQQTSTGKDVHAARKQDSEWPLDREGT